MFGSEGPSGSSSGGRSGDPGEEFTLSAPLRSFALATVSVLTKPKSFFRDMARQGDFISPAVYAVVCGLISIVFAGLLALAFGGSTTPAVPGTQAEVEYGTIDFVVDVVLSPILTVVGLFLTAGVYHLLVLLLARSSNGGFEATFRVVSYVSVIQFLLWIPIVNLIALIYGLYIAYFGIREVHGMTQQRAAAVVALPALVIILLIIIFGIALAALFSLGS